MRGVKVSIVVVLLLAGTGLCGCRTCTQPLPPCTDCLPEIEGGSWICEVDIPPPPTELPSLDNLVFAGGGVKGAAYGGALKVLDSYGLLAPATRVAGTSAGSITAMAVSFGLSGDQICELVANIPFARFEDPASTICHLESLEQQYGWYSGDFALCFLECMVERYTGSRSTTFADLHELVEACDPASDKPCFKDLYVIGTDVNRHKAKIFSWTLTPEMPIADAVRISMSIPYFFASRDLDGDTMVDGGVLWNYPIYLFDELPPDACSVNDNRLPTADTLGFNLGLLEFDRRPINNLVQYTKELVTTILDAQLATLVLRPDDVKRTVFINTGEISAIDFNLTPEQVHWLVVQGADATEKYLAAKVAREQAPDWLLERLRVRMPEMRFER
jgi:NTE family protein